MLCTNTPIMQYIQRYVTSSETSISTCISAVSARFSQQNRPRIPTNMNLAYCAFSCVFSSYVHPSAVACFPFFSCDLTSAPPPYSHHPWREQLAAPSAVRGPFSSPELRHTPLLSLSTRKGPKPARTLCHLWSVPTSHLKLLLDFLFF